MHFSFKIVPMGSLHCYLKIQLTRSLARALFTFNLYFVLKSFRCDLKPINKLDTNENVYLINHEKVENK